MQTQPKPPGSSRSRISLHHGQDKAIDLILADLRQRCPAQYVLIADASGQLLSLSGDRNSADPVVLAALIAGDMAASTEITRAIGQYQRSQFSLREGALCNTFIVEAAEQLVLFVQVARDVPLGWARMIISEACQELEQVMSNSAQDAKELELDVKLDGLTEWADDAMSTLCSK